MTWWSGMTSLKKPPWIRWNRGRRGTDPQWGWLLGSASGEAREHEGWKLAPRQVESQPSKGWGAPRTLGNVILVVAWTKGKYRGAAGDQLGQGTNPTKRPWQLRPASAEWEEAIRLGMQENIFYFYIYTHICVLMGLVLLFKWESSHVYERHRSLLFN